MGGFPLGPQVVAEEERNALAIEEGEDGRSEKKPGIILQQVNRIKPDLVLLDRHAMVSKAIFYENMGVTVAFLSPMPDPEPAPNVPPFSSGFVPRDNWFSKKYVETLCDKFSQTKTYNL